MGEKIENGGPQFLGYYTVKVLSALPCARKSIHNFLSNPVTEGQSISQPISVSPFFVYGYGFVKSN